MPSAAYTCHTVGVVLQSFPKSLSVNYVDLQGHLAQHDDRSCDVVERHEAALELLASYQQLAKAIEPAVADRDYPASRLAVWITPLGLGLLAAVNDVRNVAMRFDDLQRAPTSVAGIGAQVLAVPHAGCLALVEHGRLEHGIELRDIMRIGPGHDERQRDAAGVHQQVAFAPLFFPDQLDCVQLPPVPKVP